VDSNDIYLSMMLLSNSRTPYRALAEKLNLSVNAVHKRVQTLIDQGIIREFIARPGFAATGALIALVHGATGKKPEILMHELSEHKSIYWLSAASGGYLYIGTYLRTIQELSPLLEFVQVKTGINELKTSIIGEVLGFTQEPLDTLDYQIINSLSKDSRKPVAEVAFELGLSVKTIRKRLNTMIINSTIELTINWYPDAANDIVSMTHIKTMQGSNLDENTLKKDFNPSLIMIFQPINATREFLCITWSPTMKEMRTLTERIRADPRIESATPNILYMGWLFNTWRDQISTEKILKAN
jgi:DNA-binding Lrp family transcriptional regulator